MTDTKSYGNVVDFDNAPAGVRLMPKALSSGSQERQ